METINFDRNMNNNVCDLCNNYNDTFKIIDSQKFCHECIIEEKCCECKTVLFINIINDCCNLTNNITSENLLFCSEVCSSKWKRIEICTGSDSTICCCKHGNRGNSYDHIYEWVKNDDEKL